jgi:plasmid stabilization system protein ParE
VEILFSNSAVNDLERIKEYYNDEGVPQIGEQFVESLIDHIQTLRDNSDIGRIVPEFDEPKIKDLIHPPFRIVNLRELSSIHVIRVWRSERELVLSENKA